MVNGESIDKIIETALVKAQQGNVRPESPLPECNPGSVANALNTAYDFYKHHGFLYDTHPFVLLSNQYIIPLLRGIKELIVSPHSETEIMSLLDRGFTFNDVESAKNSFVMFARTKCNSFSPAELADGMLESLNDWFIGDFSPDSERIHLLGKFFCYLAAGKSRSYF